MYLRLNFLRTSASH